MQLVLLLAPQLGLHDHLGSLWLRACIAAVAVGVVVALLRFRRWGDELQHTTKFIRSVVFLIAVVATENFCTWATSAADEHKHEYTPLQDNLRIATLWAFDHAPLLRTVVMGWRVDMHFLLYCLVGLCLSVMWDQVPYSGFGMGCRFMDVIAWTHAIRTVAFMVTVLPNPAPGCYERHGFPAEVPRDLWEFIRYGFSAKRGSGCNDLVISGHGVVYTAVPLALSTYYPLPLRRGGAALLAWLAVVKLCLQETVDGTHYSVDMFLAVVVTSLVWHWRSSLYPASEVWRERPRGTPPDRVPYALVALVAALLVIVFVGVAGT